MSDCIFCKIVAGEVPCARLIETDDVLSFVDIGPVNAGHSLVIPKRHCESITDMTEAETESCARAVRALAAAVMKATGAPGCNVLQNNDACAGQVVPHAHFHVIPRWPDDGFRFGWRTGSYGDGELAEMQSNIVAALDA